MSEVPGAAFGGEAEGARQVPPSAVHGLAPEFLSAIALFSAPVEVESALARLETLWQMEVRGQWETVDAPQGEEEGRIFHFETASGVTVLLTPVEGPAEAARGTLPEHSFHIMATFFAPITDPRTGELVMRRVPRTFTDPVTGMLLEDEGAAAASEPAAPRDAIEEVQRRRRAIDAHVALTQVMDALLREESAVGLYRPELGVVQPPAMVGELADVMAEGEAPLPLWVSVRTFRPDVTNARTLGLPLFGHLDLDVWESLHSEEEVGALLSRLVEYVLSTDSFLMPGSTIEWEGEELAILQANSPGEGEAILRITY